MTPGDEFDIDGRVANLTGVIVKAAEGSLRRKGMRTRPVPWWAEHLTDMKREYQRARRRYQACRSEVAKPALREEYKRRYRVYRNGVRRQKKKSWDEFIQEQTEKNPWGIPYRVALGKMKPPQMMAAIRVDGAQATTLEESVTMYLDYTYPKDDPSQDSEEDDTVRRGTLCPPGTELCPAWDIWDLRLAVERQRTGRAPGLDGVDAAILKHCVPQLEEELLAIYNLCLDRGYFPGAWKIADLRLLYKGKGKDKEQPKAYRPICLLSVLSKVLEQLMVVSLRPVLRAASNDRQYGSTKGRGTADALMRVRMDVEEREERYVMMVLFDISSAFDAVWWPGVLRRLQELEAPSNLYCLVSSYLSNRRVKVRGGSCEVERGVERGCPQGSVLGPALWKLIFDQLLWVLGGEGFRAVAYVDDLAVTVAANSRARLVEEGERCVGTVAGWCGRTKLQMAASKTQAVLLKGSTDRAHPISLNIGGERVRLGEELTYLGVRFRRKFDVAPHLAYLQDRVIQTMNGLSRLGGAFWGLRYPATRTVYKGVVLGILRYASPAWSRSLTIAQRKKLATTQRLALLRLTRAYRTVSHEAVQVLAGEMPLDLILREDTLRFDVGRRGPEALPEGLGRRIGEEPRRWKEVLREDSLGEWNRRWVASEKGSTLRKFFPTVYSRLAARWVQPEYWSSQILTGHGGFRAKLRSHGKNIDPLCPVCRVPDTAEHAVVRCVALEEDRARLIRRTGLFALDEADFPRLVEAENYPHFREFVGGWKKVVGHCHFTLSRGPLPEVVEEDDQGGPPSMPGEEN